MPFVEASMELLQYSSELPLPEEQPPLPVRDPWMSECREASREPWKEQTAKYRKTWGIWVAQ